MRDPVRQLAHSARFRLSHEYETVWLMREGARPTEIGDFYGDPHTAIIDRGERWCAVGGNGLIVYFLEEPFEAYQPGRPSAQYFELGRKERDTWWVERIQQTGPWEIQVLLETGLTQHISFERTSEGCAFVVRAGLPTP
ncbi:hypothetical protein LRH25_08775 [Ideonella azotifigens]|uniref:DUF3085 domain-containing protein n=1 Tax=Ideonella azotifigens TaxID=513160 RepID=A0ABP3VU56_9BURK|nr:hypothetical protein [Ideonella azotifigens]MCD2340435.1 hypothetical protein [Ideonella azotifigens]